jgi:hypothetical protein
MVKRAGNDLEGEEAWIQVEVLLEKDWPHDEQEVEEVTQID